MTVRCPRCSNRYRLPEVLLGPGGARVRCPGCGNRFDVARQAEPEGRMRLADAHALDYRVAADVLQALADRAPRWVDAHARGRLFSEFGPALLEAFDEYRRRSGPGASARVFRDLLRERFRIELRP